MQIHLFLMAGWVKDYTVCTKVCVCVCILGECLVFHSQEQCRWMQRDSGTHDKCLHPALIAQIEAVPHLSKLDVAVSSLWYDNGMLLSEGKCKLQAVIWWHAPADMALSLSPSRHGSGFIHAHKSGPLVKLRSCGPRYRQMLPSVAIVWLLW